MGWLLDLKRLNETLKTERKLLSLLQKENFSIREFQKAVQESGRGYTFTESRAVSPFINSDNTINVSEYKDSMKKFIEKEIVRTKNAVEELVSPLREAQSLLADKEIQDLLKE